MSALTNSGYYAQASSLADADPALDPSILQMITKLNQNLAATGEPIEGNVCYWNDTPPEEYRASPPITDPDHMSKRANLATLARRHRSMLEIGLNGGHSALICLASNPQLHFFSVDIVGHQYTEVAAAFLKAKFQRRFHFWRGDSREVLPRMAIESPTLRFDLLHVDGGHGADLAFTDISNSLRMAAKGAELIFDDVNAPHLGEVLEVFVRLGYLVPSQDIEALFKNPLHDILTVC